MFSGIFNDDDPFFGSHMRSMQQMNSMMSSIFDDPFGMMGGFGMGGRPAIGGPRHTQEISPFGAFGFPDLSRMMQMTAGDPNCHSYSSSTVMTMSSGPDGRPQVYQASQSTRTAPGGVKETKKSVCDTRTGTKKMAIGHHIGERAHILERQQDLRSGQQEETQEFINLEEDDAEDFNREFEHKTRPAMHRAIGAAPHRGGRELPALPSSSSNNNRTRNRTNNTSRRHYPAITSTTVSSTSHPNSSSYRNDDDDTDGPIITHPPSPKRQTKKRDHTDYVQDESDSEPEELVVRSSKSLKSSHKK